MMTQTIFILVPSPQPTGPIKGAVALANALVSRRRVIMVFLKAGPGNEECLDSRVEEVSLANIAGGWPARVRAYRKLLRKAGGRDKVASVSMCLSADFVNRGCRDLAVTCNSVRGNLPRIYQHDYGWTGRLLGFGHLWALRPFDHVVAMTQAMARQIHTLTGIHPAIIGNFLDEAALEPHRRNARHVDGQIRFVFVGNLTRHKRPELVVRAVAELLKGGHDVHLEVIGTGPLLGSLESLVSSLGVAERVRLHGHVASPYSLIADADALVLPSHSEGISRAAMEALYLGVPCVLRAVDGNVELLDEPHRGAVFTDEGELPSLMLKVAAQRHGGDKKTCLLPPAFRQESAAERYLALLENTR